jgi:hypothetical protein
MLLGAAFLLAGAEPARAKSIFDGLWSVTIITEAGNCDPTYRYPIQINDGTVSYNAEQGSGVVEISGKVAATGQVKVNVSRGEQQAEGAGRLSQNTGTGTWIGKSATQGCSGRWEAQRN